MILLVGYIAYRHQMSKDREGICYFAPEDCWRAETVPTREEMEWCAWERGYRDAPFEPISFAFSLKGRPRLFDPVYRYIEDSP